MTDSFGVRMACVDIVSRFSEYYVDTNNLDVLEAIRRAKSVNKMMLRRMYRNIYNYLVAPDNDTLQANYRSNNQAWKDWCADCLLFYAIRHVLFKKRIPICNPANMDN
jgi:hypothetical protein